jgi:hypothetical protein
VACDHVKRRIGGHLAADGPGGVAGEEQKELRGVRIGAIGGELIHRAVGHGTCYRAKGAGRSDEDDRRHREPEGGAAHPRATASPDADPQRHEAQCGREQRQRLQREPPQRIVDDGQGGIEDDALVAVEQHGHGRADGYK